MLGSMYGDAGFTFPVNTATGIGDASQIKQTFLGRGKMIRPNWSQAQNTTLSAVIVVSKIKPFLMEMTDMIVIRVQISCLTTFRTLKTLGITQL